MDKYPKLDEYEGEAPEGDFLSREKALLGEEEAAKFGGAESVSDAEFESNYPALDNEADTATDGVAATLDQSNGTHARSETPSESVSFTRSSGGVNLADSEFIKEWKVKYELEIERRDAASAERQAETKKAAEKAIDDFYENYNSKKETAIAKVREEADQFIKQRDETTGSGGTTWERVAKLIDNVGVSAATSKPADKTRFKELVTALKSDPNAPGAAGY